MQPLQYIFYYLLVNTSMKLTYHQHTVASSAAATWDPVAVAEPELVPEQAMVEPLPVFGRDCRTSCSSPNRSMARAPRCIRLICMGNVLGMRFTVNFRFSLVMVFSFYLDGSYSEQSHCHLKKQPYVVIIRNESGFD